MRGGDLRPRDRPERARSGFLDGLSYVRGRPDLKVLLLMLLVFGALGLNFAIFISTMAASVLHADARGFGSPDLGHGRRLGRRRADGRSAEAF